MSVCHVGTLPLQQMGSVTRALVSGLSGAQTYALLGGPLPTADVYVLHCFKSRHERFRNFERPSRGAKVVSLVHSTAPCEPCLTSDAVVALTHWSAYDVRVRCSTPCEVIEAGIDVAPFAKNEPDYASRTLGRITRNAPGKFHPLWSAALAQILACAPLVKARLVVDTDADLLKDARVEYVTGVKIGDDEAKVEALAPLSMAVIAEGDFEETFSVGMLECMAMGLPIVYLYQPALHEVLKGLPTCCDSIAGMVERVVALIDEPDELKMLGRMAREVAYEYSSIRMLMRWERLLGGLS